MTSLVNAACYFSYYHPWKMAITLTLAILGFGPAWEAILS